MRVGSLQMSQDYLRRLNKAYDKVMDWNEKLDGENLHRPSDDPVQCVRTMRYTQNLVQNEQYAQNLKDAQSWMKSTDNALGQMVDLLKTVTERTNEGANSYLSEADSKAIGMEINEIINQMLSLGNSQLGDRYLFSGQADKTKPYNDPYVVEDKADLKALDDEQSTAFGTDQLFVLNDQNGGDKYYLDINTGNIYDADYVKSGYKENGDATAGAIAHSDDLQGDVDTFFITAGDTVAPETVGQAKSDGALADALTVTTADGRSLTLKLSTSDQTVVSYYGDANKISMVVQTGEAVPANDSVNANGIDIFGTDVFGNKGSQVINDLYAIRDHLNACDAEWLSDDGIQRAENIYNQVLNAETTIGSRMETYNMLESMMDSNNAVIQTDITNASAAKMDEVIVQLTTSDVIYRMSLSVSSKILPPSLADYL